MGTRGIHSAGIIRLYYGAVPVTPSNRFPDARLKLDRADKHIGDIKTRICRLEDSCFADIEVHPKFRYQQIKYDLSDRTAVKDIGILTGDVLHNLKCALDYAWLTTLERHAPSAITDKTQFPVHPSLDSLEGALKKRQIDLCCRPLFDLMLTKVKAYSGGNDALWAVKELNILDKHRLLTPLIHYTSIAGVEMEDERGESRRGSSRATTGTPPLYITIPDGWQVKDKGKPSITALFDEGTSAHYNDVPSMLEFYSVVVLQVVHTLERFKR